jgi:hypothetical protein
MKRAVANLPLHGGDAPAWLFNRKARLGETDKADALKRLGRVSSHQTS